MKPRLHIANSEAPESSPGRLPAPAAAGPVMPRPAPALQVVTPAPPATSPGPVGGPLPKRPKGSLFIGSVLALVVGAVAYTAWNATYRYAAYGTVTGQTVTVPPPWPGTVEALFVREGDLVRQGDPLAQLSNPQFQDEIERLSDDLRVAQSELDAQVAELTLAAQQSQDRQQLALAEYYQLLGELLAEQARLNELSGRLARSEKLAVKGAVSGQDQESMRLMAEGQRAKVERLELAVAELRKRTETDESDHKGAELLQPKLVRIEQLQAAIGRARDRLRQGTIRAPAGGRVLTIGRQVGEYVEQNTAVVELLDEQSLEITLLVRQVQTAGYRLGESIDVEVAPFQGRLTCAITRIGDEYQPAPPQIETQFRHGERLLPVLLRPAAPTEGNVPLRLGSEVRQPRTWTWRRGWGA